jgi:murein DD-endopeptidase MepM/ murein hydrolase activator NlpD
LQGTKAAIGSPVQLTAAERAATAQARQESIIAVREDRLAKLAQQGADVSQLQIQLDKAKTRVGDATVKSQERFKQSILALDTNVRRLSGTIAKAPAGAKAPTAATATGPGFFQGDPRKAISEGLIGGAFPLLFGQGLGASIGGAAGGVSGGLIGGSFGFGLSLIGTALGQVVDTAVNKLGTLGGALSNATESMAALEQAGFRVRDSQKIQIDQLEKVGQGYEAQKVVLKEIESRLGPGSVQQIERLNEAQKELSDAWAQLSLQLGTTLIPVIIEAANFINDLLGGRRPSNNASAPTPNKPRKPSDVLADLDALVAGNERNKAANREYAGLVREVEDFRRENEEKIFTMRRQAADIEKQKSDLRLEVEGRIFDMRQESARLEIENARSRAQIATESFDLQLAQQADALGGRGGEFIDQVREYLRVRETGEADLQAKGKTTKLQIAAQERELQVYILQVSDKVAAIARTVEDYKRNQAKFRFEASSRLEDYRIKAENYIFDRFKERYEYAIGSEQEILRLRMEAAAQMGVGSMPPDAAAVLGGVGTGRTEVGRGGLASPVGAQISGRPPNWNQGLGAGRGHRGQDVGVDVGTTIHAMEDAIVDSIIRGFGEVGDAVVLRYRNSGNLGVYGHINPAAGIVPGQAITAGQQIGVVTPDLRSGGRNNTHLHYEYWRRTRGPAANLLDPSERLRGAIYNRRPTAPSPVTQSQTRQAPRMLLPPAAGPTPQMLAPATTDSMFERRSSLQPDLGESLLSQIQQEGGFEDIAMSVKDARMIINKVTQEAVKGSITPDAFVAALSGIGDFAQSPDFSRRAIRNMMATPGAKAVVNTPGLAPVAIKRLMATHGKAAKAEGVNPEALNKHIGPALDLFNQMKRDNLLRSNVSLEEVRTKLQLPLYQALMGWVKENMGNPAVQGVLSKSRFGKANSFSYGAKGLVPSASGFDPKAFGVPPTPAALKAQQEYEKRKAFEASPEGRRQAEAARKYAEEFRRLREDIEKNVIRKKGAMLPDSGFDMASLSKLGTEYAPVAQLGPAPPPLALPGPGQPIPHSMRVDAPSSVTGLQVVPFTGNLPTYQPAPVATPTLPAAPQLPAAPAPMAPIDTSALTKELGKQRDELLENIELLKKLQDLENGRLLLQLGSTREVRNRLEDATREYNLEVKLLGVNTSLSQNEQERAAERIRTALATEDLNTLEKQTLGFAKELLDAKKLEQQEYDQITRGIQDRITYEKELLQLVKDRAEVARQEAFLRRAGEVRQQINLAGAGLRSGLIGTGARAFEAEMAISGNMDQAKAMAELSQRLEDQQLIWGNLEKNIVDVSNAISGGLTNGLLDVISGAKKIEDVGREVLDGIARTFADTAQQQLSTLMQRNLASMLGGPEGQLTKMLGGASATAGPQALGAASLAASNSVMAFGVALQTVTAQMGVSGALSGFSSAAAGGIGSAFSAAAPNILGSFFPGASLLPSMDFDLPDDEIGAGASAAFSPSSLANGAVQSLLSRLPSIFASAFLGGAPGMPNIFGGFRAGGGPVVPGKGYIVGEREPEFFFPSAAGKIVPRSDMEKAAALRESESSNEPIDLRYTVTEERGKRYVTEEQFLKSNAALAQRTQAMTYAGMRNSKQIREYTGI